MIDVGKFASRVPTLDGKSFFRFGVSPDNIVSELRKFADAVEAGGILVQKIQAGQVAAVDDFLLQAIMIEFAEREDILEQNEKTIAREKDLVGLYADGREFPVVLARPGT